MPGAWRVRAQVALVLVLFLGSVVLVLANAFVTLGLPRRELIARDQLRDAVRRMAEAAAPLASTPSGAPGAPTEDLDAGLRDAAQRVLTDFAGVEGGFYLAGEPGRFTGYAFPTGPTSPHPPLARTEPPPLEAPYIRAQARQSLSLGPGEDQVQVRDVATSRVMVVT